MSHRYLGRMKRLADSLAAEMGIDNPRVVEAVGSVPRHLFVEEVLWPRAFTDDALPIGHGQTISKVSTVLRMTHLLDPGPGHRVLEVGTGSGFQTAVLARLAGEVYSVERVAPLAVKARRMLNRLGAFRVHVRTGDGSLGWPEAAPFERILVTAAAGRLPEALRGQLAVGGRLVAPVDSGVGQVLKVVERLDPTTWKETELDACRFVPLVEGGGR